eukprot:s1104_g24.t1
MTTASSSSKKPRVLTKEQQINLVVKLLAGQPKRARDVREKIEDGKGIVCHGLEFSLAILRESLEKFEEQAQESEKHGVQLEVQSDCMGSKKRKCGDENQKPADNKGTPDGDETSRPVKRSPARPTKSSTLRMKVSPRAQQAPERSPAAEGDAEGPEDGPDGLSVKALKARLAQHGLHTDGCVEKAELQALWEKFETWRQRPLHELQDQCQQRGGLRFGSVLECAKYLMSGGQRQPAGNRFGRFWTATTSSPTAAKEPAAPTAPAPLPTPAVAVPAVDREQDAQREAKRILPLRRESYLNPTSWGFAVLGVPKGTTEVSAVQRAYRALMRKLHPDRAGQSEDVVKAVEKVREAKEACERGLSRQEPPEQPRELRSEALCSAAGRRKFQLSWTAPTIRDAAPVRRYVVAAHDPAYGRALTITVLEPDYSQELRSFVPIEHLTSYVMAEQDLQKMPKLWTQTSLQVQVAAANEAGQSAWSTLKIPLTGPSAGNAAASAPPMRLQRAPLPSGPTGGSGFATAATMQKRMHDAEDVAAFDTELRKIHGIARLRAFLEPRKKGILMEWLRSVNWSAYGSKQDLVERVIFIREAMVC